jgi:hypothetical protein
VSEYHSANNLNWNSRPRDIGSGMATKVMRAKFDSHHLSNFHYYFSGASISDRKNKIANRDRGGSISNVTVQAVTQFLLSLWNLFPFSDNYSQIY